VLEQRSEVEQFFLEALAQCKAAVAEERASAYRADLAAYRTAMRDATLPSSAQALAFGRSRSSSSSANFARTGTGPAGPGGAGSAFGGGEGFGSQLGPASTPGGGGSASPGRVPFPKIRPAPRGAGALLLASPGGGGSGVSGPPHVRGAVGESALPLGTASGKQVQLADLSWGDRDRVLRLLFAKINAVQSHVKRMPDHPLQQTSQGS
jgi:hypothetical protein